MLHINENFLLLIGNIAIGPSLRKYCFDSTMLKLCFTLQVNAISFLSSLIKEEYNLNNCEIAFIRSQKVQTMKRVKPTH